MNSFAIILVAIGIEQLLSCRKVHTIVVILNVLQPVNKNLRVSYYQLITVDKVGIYVVDNSTPNTLMVLQHVEQHRTTANEGLYISNILKIIETGWQ